MLANCLKYFLSRESRPKLKTIKLTFGNASEQHVIIVCKVANMVDRPSDSNIAKNKIDQ